MKKQSDQIPEGYFRVTEILSPFVSFAGIDPAVLANAADRGTRTHKFCEVYTKARALHAHDFVIDSVDEDCKPYFKSFIGWFEKMVDSVIYQEERLSCPKIKVSGQLDMVAILKGDSEWTLVDIKTPQQASSSWQLQTAAYKHLLKAVKGETVQRRICLILDRHGDSPRIVEYTDHPKDEKMFLNAVELFRFFH